MERTFRRRRPSVFTPPDVVCRSANFTLSRHNCLPHFAISWPSSRGGLSASSSNVINERRRCRSGLFPSIVHLIAHPVTLTASRGLVSGSPGTRRPINRKFELSPPEGHRVSRPPLSTYSCVSARSSGDSPLASLCQLRDYHLDRRRSGFLGALNHCNILACLHLRRIALMRVTFSQALLIICRRRERSILHYPVTRQRKKDVARTDAETFDLPPSSREIASIALVARCCCCYRLVGLEVARVFYSSRDGKISLSFISLSKKRGSIAVVISVLSMSRSFSTSSIRESRRRIRRAFVPSFRRQR